ncbi:MAG TPA: hypothetical protein VD995_11985 [Azospirillum sp.]|nr:hypothetical protein [Azospirillum sp.]
MQELLLRSHWRMQDSMPSASIRTLPSGAAWDRVAAGGSAGRAAVAPDVGAEGSALTGGGGAPVPGRRAGPSAQPASTIRVNAATNGRNIGTPVFFLMN